MPQGQSRETGLSCYSEPGRKALVQQAAEGQLSTLQISGGLEIRTQHPEADKRSRILTVSGIQAQEGDVFTQILEEAGFTIINHSVEGVLKAQI